MNEPTYAPARYLDAVPVFPATVYPRTEAGRPVPLVTTLVSMRIIVSLVLCTFLYIAVAAVLTGMVPYNRINIDAPVSDAFRQAGLPWAQLLISIGAVAGITSVLLVMMLSQPRIFLAMARDGLLPTGFFIKHCTDS